MALVGNIRDFGLSDFLYLVDRGYKTGCLHLDRPNDMAALFFERGKLVSAYRNRAETVTDLLVSRGKLSADQATHVLETFRADGSLSVSAALIDRQIIARDDLQGMLQTHIEESIYTLFGWPEGDFRFEQNQRPEPEYLIMPTPLPVEHLIMEGVRRIDEWSRIRDRIPSTDMVVRFLDQSDGKAKGINLAPEEWRVFARINGRDTLAEIAAKTNMSDFDVCRIVYGFLTAGLVDVLRRQIPGAPTSRVGEAVVVKKSLVSRIINRIRGM